MLFNGGFLYGKGKAFSLPSLYRGAASAAAAFQQRITMAEDDGWTAAWDASNPDSLTLRESGGSNFVTSLADGLGNYTAAVQATEAKQPTLISAGLGDLDLLRFSSASAQRLQTTVFGTPQAIPFFILAVIKFAADNDFAFCAEDTTNRNSLWRTAGNVLMRAVATDLTVETGVDANHHVYGLLFNNATSKAWFDKALAVEGDLAGTDPFNQLSLGSRADDTSHLEGDIALFYMYPGIPSDAIRNRMFDMVHDHSGITPAA